MYSFAPGDALKDEFRLLVRGQLNKLILHAYASEVCEYIYSTDTSESEKRRMVFSLYGNFTLMLDEILQKTKNASLKVFIEQKPQLGGKILDKLDPMLQKMIEKGN